MSKLILFSLLFLFVAQCAFASQAYFKAIHYADCVAEDLPQDQWCPTCNFGIYGIAVCTLIYKVSLYMIQYDMYMYVCSTTTRQMCEQPRVW